MKKLPIFIIFSLTLFSCKKTIKEQPPAFYTSYSGLEIGNYWIYWNYKIDEAGKESIDTSYKDSVSITGDTLIRGSKFYIESCFLGNHLSEIRYLRDSLHYIIDHLGNILFSSEDFTTIFKTDYQSFGGDTVCKREYKMGERNALTVVPADTFYTDNYTLILYFYPNYANGNPIRNVYFKYAAGIGLVYSNQIYGGSTKSYYDRRLARYKVH